MATAAERLAEAKSALHQILIGQGVASVRDSSGESINYSRANIGALRAYIRELEIEVAGTTPISGPIRPVFL